MIPRAAGSPAGTAATPADRPASTPGAATNPLIRYPGTAPDEPSWQSWLLLLTLGAAAPFLIRAAIRRDEARYVRPSWPAGRTKPATPPATVGHREQPVEEPRPEPSPGRPALERTPVAAQRRG